MASAVSTSTESPRPAPRVGAVTHVEWLCADLQAAQAFLQRWLGWEFTAFGANFLEHAPAAGPRIGLLQAGTGDAPVRPAQAACRAYLGTDALEALLEQAAALGAEVSCPPRRIDGYGHYARVQVPGGPQIGLFSRGSPPAV